MSRYKARGIVRSEGRSKEELVLHALHGQHQYQIQWHKHGGKVVAVGQENKRKYKSVYYSHFCIICGHVNGTCGPKDGIFVYDL